MSKNSDPQQATAQKPKSAMGVASLVLGIIALLTSFLPFINNASALLAFLGTIFGIVGLVATVRGTRAGKGMAIAAVVVNVIALIIVVASQSAYSAAIEEATSTNAPTAASTQSSASSAAAASSSASASSANNSVPKEYTSALSKAKSYSNTMHMSKQGIYDQLTSSAEQFSSEAAQYAIDSGL